MQNTDINVDRNDPGKKKEINAMSVCTLYIGGIAPYLRVISQHMVDWMHTLFVSGVFNIIAHLFADALRPAGGYQRYADYLQPWVWPKTKASTTQLRHICNPKRIESNNTAKQMKGSASELLSVYSIFAHMAQEYLEMGVLQTAATVLIKFAIIVDLLLIVPHGNVDPYVLHVAITEFMGAVVTAFGAEAPTPPTQVPPTATLASAIRVSPHVDFMLGTRTQAQNAEAVLPRC